MNRRFKLVLVSFSTVLVVMLLLGAAMGRSASPEDAYKHLAVYTEVLSRIKSEYVEEPDIKNVTLGAVNGMLEAIDPYASYLNADQYKQYLKNQEAKKGSVGVIVSKKFGYVSVVDVVPGTGAAKASLSTGDFLESINGVATRDMPLAYAEMLLDGEPGTSVEVSVLRLRKPEPQKITLTRSAMKYPPVTAKMMPDQIGLVQVASLESGKVKEVVNAFESLQKQGAKKYLLDLRNCGIGKPEDGLALANLFVDKGELAYLQGQKVAKQDFQSDPAKAIFKTVPLTVMTNRGTANAAEVAASALLDNKRAELVGERTYGDAAVRKAVTMDDGAAVILSVAKYYSASGKAIQDTGVTPSVVVTEAEPVVQDDDDTAAAPEAQQKRQDGDAILKKALEVATKGKGAAEASKTDPAVTSDREHLPPTTVKRPTDQKDQ